MDIVASIKHMSLLVGAVLCLVFLAYLALVIFYGVRLPTLSQIEQLPGERFAHFAEGDIRYSETGFGTSATIFLHGFNTGAHIWEDVFRQAGECGTFIRLDIPGYGASQWRDKHFDLPLQSRRLYEFVKQKQLQRVTLVGVSMGASLSATFAADYPDLVHAVVIGAPSGYPGSLTMSKRVANSLAPGAMNKLATMVADSFLFRLLFPDSAAIQALTVTSSYNQSWVANLSRIEAPTVVVWSPGDAGVPYAYAGKIAERLKQSVVITLPEEVGHNIPLNAPAVLARLACHLAPGNGLSASEMIETVRSIELEN